MGLLDMFERTIEINDAWINDYKQSCTARLMLNDKNDGQSAQFA